MNSRIYFSTGAFASRKLPQILDDCLAEEIDKLELSGGVVFDPEFQRRVLHLRPSIRFLVHNYFPPPKRPFVLNLASDEHDALEQSIEHCKNALLLSNTLEAPFYSVHSAFAARLRPEHLGSRILDAPPIPRQKAYQTFVSSVHELCKFASKLGIGLLVENNVVAPFNLVDGRNDLLLMATADEMLEFHADVGHDALGFLIDVGHVNVTARTLGFDRVSFIDRVAPFVRAFHLSENNGEEDENKPISSDAWFLPAIAAQPEATMVIEAYNLDANQRRSCRDIIAAL